MSRTTILVFIIWTALVTANYACLTEEAKWMGWVVLFVGGYFVGSYRALRDSHG